MLYITDNGFDWKLLAKTYSKFIDSCWSLIEPRPKSWFIVVTPADILIGRSWSLLLLIWRVYTSLFYTADNFKTRFLRRFFAQLDLFFIFLICCCCCTLKWFDMFEKVTSFIFCSSCWVALIRKYFWVENQSQKAVFSLFRKEQLN